MLKDAPRMATRKSKTSSPKASVPKADEVPVTRAMFDKARVELLERIGLGREEARADTGRLDAKVDAVKSELLQRIDEARADTGRLDAKVDAVKSDLGAKIDAVKAELKADIHEVKAELNEVKAELKADIHELKVGLHEVKADVHAIRAQTARTEVLMEEQNALNKIVLDALTAVLSRQNQVEQRVTHVEDTIRALATAHPAG
jgi:chromosome segregation ATPase